MCPLLGSSLRTGPVVSDSALASAASQHTDTNKITKAALKCYALHSYLGTPWLGLCHSTLD